MLIAEATAFLKEAGAEKVTALEDLDNILSVDEGLFLVIVEEANEDMDEALMVSFPMDTPPDVSAIIALSLADMDHRLSDAVTIVQCHQFVEEDGEVMLQFIGDEDDPDGEENLESGIDFDE